jgi:hypothetical protein
MDVMMRDAWLVFQSAIAVLYCVTAGAQAHAATAPIDATLQKRRDQSEDLGLSTAGFRLARSLP